MNERQQLLQTLEQREQELQFTEFRNEAGAGARLCTRGKRPGASASRSLSISAATASSSFTARCPGPRPTMTPGSGAREMS